MAVMLSTGLAAVQTAAMAAAFQYGCIEVYSGVQPSSADLPPNGTLLGRITADGGEWTAGSTTNGLRWLSADRYMIKDSNQSWVLTGVASGTAQWFRVLPNTLDSGAASLSSLRIDGAIGASGATGDVQFFLPDTAITASSSINITNWWHAVPPIGA